MLMKAEAVKLIIVCNICTAIRLKICTVLEDTEHQSRIYSGQSAVRLRCVSITSRGESVS